ncbi:MAG: Hpt domain-containing protein [Methylovirgula sp.]
MRALTQEKASVEPQADLGNLVHQLKGSALAIGAFLLAETAAETERDLAERASFSAPGTAEAALSPLAAVLAQSLTAIDAYISRLKI